jgi:hypothetical protein
MMSQSNEQSNDAGHAIAVAPDMNQQIIQAAAAAAMAAVQQMQSSIIAMHYGEPSLQVTFKGRNCHAFLKFYELQQDILGTNDKGCCQRLPFAVPAEFGKIIMTWDEWKKNNWNEVKKKMVIEFLDEEDNKYTMADLNSVVAKATLARKKTGDTIENFITFHRRFLVISVTI